MKCNIVYSIIVPLYNEELVINKSYYRIAETMNSTKESYEIIFINDGSSDNTKNKAEIICKNDNNVKLINFSRNFGHQSAITAGMNFSKGKAIIIIDADLQDPPEIMLKMIEKWKQGFDIVYGKRTERDGETYFKKITSKVYYRILKKLSDIDIPMDAGDFRLIDRAVCNALNSLPEKNRYVRGLVSWVGYKQTFVEFIRKERYAGKSKYSLKKMIKLAFDGITSFSHKPLKIAGYLGGIIFTLGIFFLIIDSAKSIIWNKSIINLGFLLFSNLTMLGIILISIGIMGEYLGRIFDECQSRPMYIISSTMNCNNRETI